MDNDELLATVEREEANCILHFSSLLSEQRRKALQYYYGQPYGNEVEGRSQVVTTEVKDAVEGILPALMQIFTASDEVVRFEAQNPDDEAAAQQATDYVNYIFSRLNNGFLALYCLFKDALLLKNGYVKVYWDDYTDVTKETYENLDDMEFQSLVTDGDLELIEHTEKPDEYGMQQMANAMQQLQAQLAQLSQARPQNPQQMQQMQQQSQQIQQQVAQLESMPKPMLHDAKFKRTKKYGKVCIDPIPPEEVLISRETPNELNKARFVEHRTLRTLSEIRQMGYEVPDDLADYAPNADFNLERVERLKYDDALAYRQDSDTNDPSTKRVWLCEAYIRVDYDGDGIAELRKVTKVGKLVLDNEEFDSIPIIGGTTNLMPHKHYGLSAYDEVGDIQLIKSTITRQLLDNAYVANNSRTVVLDGMVNMQDLLTSRPGGVIRAKAIGAVQQLNHSLLGQPFYNLLDYFDKIKQNRIGATDFPNAVDPDAINSKAAFVDAFKNAAMERIALRARLMAETAVKQICWKILELVSKHQNKKQMVKLRGKWVEVDPREWKDRFNMTVTVGLGTGNQNTTLQGAMGILQVQEGMLKMGMGRLVSEQNMYASGHQYAKAVFPKHADAFFTNPATLPPPEPQPNPDVIKLELKAQQMQMQDQQKKMALAMQAQMEQNRQRFDAYMAQFNARLEAAQAEMDRRLEAEKMQRDHIAELAKVSSSEKQGVVDALTTLKVAEKQSQQEIAKSVFESLADRMSQVQQQAHEQHMQTREHLIKLAELAQAEKEIVRDEKGKAKGVRTKKA